MAHLSTKLREGQDFAPHWMLGPSKHMDLQWVLSKSILILSE